MYVITNPTVHIYETPIYVYTTFNPLTAEFLKWSRWELEVGQPTV